MRVADLISSGWSGSGLAGAAFLFVFKTRRVHKLWQFTRFRVRQQQRAELYIYINVIYIITMCCVIRVYTVYRKPSVVRARVWKIITVEHDIIFIFALTAYGTYRKVTFSRESIITVRYLHNNNQELGVWPKFFNFFNVSYDKTMAIASILTFSNLFPCKLQQYALCYSNSPDLVLTINVVV